MKKIYKICLLFSFILLLASSCNEEMDKHAYVMEGTNLGGVMPSVIFSTPKIFDIADINNTTLEFNMNVATGGEYGEYRQVVIKKSYLGGDPVVHVTIPAAQIPQDVVISAADALDGLGVDIDDIKGGDFIDWIFEIEFDDPDIKFNDDALMEAFPDFRAFFASTPDFDIPAFYTVELIEGDFGGEIPVMPNQSFTVVPGTVNSQYILEDASVGAFQNNFGVKLAYRFFYIGNNEFALNANSEPWGFVTLAGSVTRDSGTGIITVDAQYVGWAGGTICKFRMIPE